MNNPTTGTSSSTVTVRLGTPTARNRQTTLKLDPDAVIEDARELFGHAHCHALAVELHRATGWPLAIVERREPSGEWTWDHVVVADPTTADKPRGIEYVDIEGRRDDEWLCHARSREEADATGAPAKRRRVRRLSGEDELRPLVGASAELDAADWHVRCIPMKSDYAGFVARQACALLREVGASPRPNPANTTSSNKAAGRRASTPPAPKAAPRATTGARPRPASKPTKPTAPTSAPTRSGGSAMSIEEIQAGLSEVESRASAAAGQLSGVRNEVESAANLLSQLSQGSRDEEVQDALGTLRTLLDELDQLGQRTLGVGTAAMNYAGRM